MRPSREDRFWSKVDRRGPDDCWLWTAGCFDSGYGAFRDGDKLRRAHRVAWELARGPIPEGMEVCHSCDTRYAPSDTTYRRCVNYEAHLWLGTTAENQADKAQKRRGAIGERNGTHTRPESVHRGERNGNAALLVEQVEFAIVLAQSGYHKSAIAQRLGVSVPTITRILTGETWRHVLPDVPRPIAARNANYKLTPASVAEIRALKGTMSQQAIAERFGIHQTHVSDILRGVKW